MATKSCYTVDDQNVMLDSRESILDSWNMSTYTDFIWRGGWATSKLSYGQINALRQCTTSCEAEEQCGCERVKLNVLKCVKDIMDNPTIRTRIDLICDAANNRIGGIVSGQPSRSNTCLGKCYDALWKDILCIFE